MKATITLSFATDMESVDVAVWGADMLQLEMPLNEQIDEALLFTFPLTTAAAFCFSHMLFTAALKMSGVAADKLIGANTNVPTAADEAIDKLLADADLDIDL